jgi:TPR repeat protein
MAFEVGTGAYQFHLNCQYACDNPVKFIPWKTIQLSSHDYDVLQRYYEKRFCDPNMQNNLGILLSKFRNDDIEARKWFELSALQNYSGAQYNLGLMYHLGRGIAINYEVASKWFLLAAHQGHWLAQYYIGTMYLYGKGVTEDFEEAIKWYKLCAKQGDTMACGIIGEYYISDVYQNYTEAYAWFMLCSKTRKAQYHIALIHFNGYGLPQNYTEAIAWFTLSANAGFIRSQYKLGRIYERGIGTNPDLQKAITWYTMASDQNDEKSQIALTIIYMNERKYDLALKYANMNTHPISQYFLGQLYYHGCGVQPNLEQAMHHYRLATKDILYAQKIFDKFYSAKQFDLAKEILEIMEQDSTPTIISKFLQHMINHVWNNLANNRLLIGLSLNRVAPVITFSSKLDRNTKGMYMRDWHRIFINGTYFNGCLLEREIETYIENTDTLSNSTELKRLISPMTRTPTLVHEMGHALRESSHDDLDGHGSYVFQYDNTNYSMTYNEGCNFLWNLGITGYVPLR